MGHYIPNFITIINNSIKNNRNYCRIPYTSVGTRLASLLFSTGYLLYYRIIDVTNSDHIYVFMKNDTIISVIFKLKLISKSTNYIYWTCKRLWNESSIANIITNYIISTSKGVFFGTTALAFHLGGKVL